MGTVRPKQHTAERSGESEEPVAPSPSHRMGWASDEIGDDNPCLLDEEGHADQSVLMQIGLQRGLRKERRAAGADEVCRNADESLGSRRQADSGSGKPGNMRRDHLL